MNINTSADLLFSAMTPSLDQVDNVAGGALGRGIDAQLTGNYGTAAREFKRSIALSPYSDHALNAFEYLTNAQLKSGKTAEAIDTCRQATKIFPSADGFNLSLGNILFSEHRYAEALEQYLIAVRKNPTASQNRYSLGQGYLALKQYDKAEEQFKKTIQLAPQDANSYYALGQTYRMAGKYDEAQPLLDRALKINNDFAYAHLEKGIIYTERQETDRAREELKFLSRNAPELAPDLQGRIYEKSAPKFLLAYIANLKLASPPGTRVSSLDPSLATPGARKNYTVTFIFDKDMDLASVRNTANWTISRSTSIRTGGSYNWGLKVPASEIAISPTPVNVLYDPDLVTAKVTFTIAQNATGDGTVDLSHLVFKFKGTDVYGNTMDTAADEYSGISKLV